MQLTVPPHTLSWPSPTPCSSFSKVGHSPMVVNSHLAPLLLWHPPRCSLSAPPPNSIHFLIQTRSSLLFPSSPHLFSSPLSFLCIFLTPALVLSVRESFYAFQPKPLLLMLSLLQLSLNSVQTLVFHPPKPYKDYWFQIPRACFSEEPKLVVLICELVLLALGFGIGLLMLP